jgi:hypothetical protein
MNATFEDISITGLATERTRASRNGSGLRHIFLTLSAKPPAAWVELLKAERQFPRHTMWREVWVEGDAIVIDCAPEEIEKYHLRDLKEGVASTNKKYRDYTARIEAQQHREHERKAKEREGLEDLRKRLQF